MLADMALLLLPCLTSVKYGVTAQPLQSLIREREEKKIPPKYAAKAGLLHALGMGDGMLSVKSSWVCELSLKDDVQLQRAYCLCHASAAARKMIRKKVMLAAKKQNMY